MLAADHIQHLKDEGFTDEHVQVLLKLGVRTIEEAEAFRLGYKIWGPDGKPHSCRGILFPFANGFGQIRCDTPLERKGDGKPARYITPVGATSKVFSPEGCKIITEGFKDAMAGTLHGGVATGAIAGVSHYRKALRAGAGYTILFDADGWGNPSVFSNLVKAGLYLKGKIQLLPEIEGEPKAGLCEYFKAGYTSEHYVALIKAAMKPQQLLMDWPNHWGGLNKAQKRQCRAMALSLAAQYLKKIEQETLVDAIAENCKLKPSSVSRELTKLIKKIEEGKQKEAIKKGEEPKKHISALANRIKQVRRVWGKRIRLNEMTDSIELDGEPIDSELQRGLLAIKQDIEVGPGDFEVIIKTLSSDNKYHPVREYLDQVYEQYGDDTSIFDGCIQRYFGIDDETGIYSVFLKRTLISSVARIMKPGSKVDTVLILHGSQGLGKSAFFSELATEEYFDDSFGSASQEKDAIIKLSRNWICELGEIENTFKAKDVSRMKALISTRIDSLRESYGRRDRKFKRTAIIVGSTNKDEFLADKTGNRRYWVIPVLQKIPIQQLRQERDRIWAAAVALYKAGEQWWLTDLEEAGHDEVIRRYETTDVWESKVWSYIRNRDMVTADEVLENGLNIPLGYIDRAAQNRVTDVLKSLGWKKGSRRSINGRKVYPWYPLIETPHPEVVAEPKAETKTEAAPAMQPGKEVSYVPAAEWKGRIVEVKGDNAVVEWDGTKEKPGYIGLCPIKDLLLIESEDLEDF